MRISPKAIREASKALISQSRELVQDARRTSARARALVQVARKSTKKSASLTPSATDPNLTTDGSDHPADEP